jgi:hypothetical protein
VNFPDRFRFVVRDVLTTSTRTATTSSTWTAQPAVTTWRTIESPALVNLIDSKALPEYGSSVDLTTISVRWPFPGVEPKGQSSTTSYTYPPGQTSTTALTRYNTVTTVYVQVLSPKNIAQGGIEGRGIYTAPSASRPNRNHSRFFAKAAVSTVPTDFPPDPS